MAGIEKSPCETAFCGVEKRFAYTGGKAGNARLQNSAYAVEFGRSVFDDLLHARAHFIVRGWKFQRGKLIEQRFELGGVQTGHGNGVDMTKLENLGADVHAFGFKNLAADRTCGNDRRGQPAGKVTAAAIVLPAVIFFKRAPIRVARTQARFKLRIVLRAGIGVFQ